MATLNVTNFVSIFANGAEHVLKQGTSASDPKTPFEISVTGRIFDQGSDLADDAAKALWVAANDYPATFDHGWFWADQDCYLQLIGTATNVVVPVKADVPVYIPPSLLAAEDTTVISATPTVTALSKIACWNASDSTLNWRLLLVD